MNTKLHQSITFLAFYLTVPKYKPEKCLWPWSFVGVQCCQTLPLFPSVDSPIVRHHHKKLQSQSVSFLLTVPKYSPEKCLWPWSCWCAVQSNTAPFPLSWLCTSQSYQFYHSLTLQKYRPQKCLWPWSLWCAGLPPPGHLSSGQPFLSLPT